ncbi:unnamed protein product [Prorocentrum cordatum]|uniref:Myosin motor domain-containing protein n=1 Tax=Prorocentrum cordatum TaxID=2364126 RepID=A0ABN9W0D5_9DINO|nr:unnamed protein product [Polarella glacialis]
MEGAKAYVLNDAGAWRKASVVAALGSGRYRVELDSWEGGDQTGENAAGEIVEFDASKMEGGSLPFQNANMPEAGFANMTTLDHLHEAALLHNLRVRFFSANCPYTYTADIVIAMNPYRWFPELFTEERRKEYTTFDRAKMPPHAYAASSTAYSNLRESKRDQSILVSGESGAGKTETVKILMAHLAFIASSQDSMHIKRIVESNPLLESFGNAQTVRNDNSSRFGKFIELQLNGSCTLVGSKCRTYLLEKSRVISQDKGERNYHIFYQMLASDLRDTIGLGGDKTRDNMRYTRLGQSKTDKIEGETDGEKFKTTVDALALVGVDGELLTRLLKALAGVLLLGQIDFDGGSGADDAAAVSPGTSGQAAEVATILEVDAENLAKALTSRTIKMRNESVVKRLNVPAAVAARDALAKELYSRMFDWLVGKICSATTAARSESQFFVGLLDIFGFESFAINRFEQLCINYANEKLQQKFTLDVFKAVQQEYADEGIPWDRIEFKDNAPVLALIESKLGIISMLNEECVRPKGSDENFVAKLGTAHAADANFSQPKLGAQKELQFSIRHYAGSVMYTASGWLERNKDAVSGDVTALLRSSANSLISDVFSEQAKMGSDTVVTKFKTSLADLMWTVGQTSTQYVRCIKPNKNKSPVEMDNMMVVEQLRCAGVIEAIRISRAGFPARMPLKELVGRFAVLVRAVAGVGFQKGAAAVQSGRPNERELAAKVLAEMGRNAELLTQCRSLVAALIPNAEQASSACRSPSRAISEGILDITAALATNHWLVSSGALAELQPDRGTADFKAGVLEALEERRALLQQAAVTEIARRVRGQRCHRLFEQMRASVLLLQSVQRMRRERAAFLVQRRAVTILQAHRRGVLARRRTAELRRERAATRLQACQRRRAAVRGLARARVAAVRLQAQARSRSCRRQYLVDLKEFKEQAKLENQVKALQARLQEAERAAKEAAEKAAREPSAPDGVVERVVHALAADNARLRAENERLRAELERHRKP